MPARCNQANPVRFSQAPVLLPALLILIAAALRLFTLGIDARFHPDEALFAAQARLIMHQGDLLLRTTDLDKPPLTFYVTAQSFGMLGTSEFAARLPNVLFSTLSVAVLYALARALYRDPPTALLAGLLYALSPFDLAFAATVFTDVQATFWVLVAAWLAARDRWVAAGVATTLVAASKPNALLFVPLIVALGTARQAQPSWMLRDVIRRWWRFVWPLALGLVVLIVWDATRAPRSFLELGWQHNDPGRFIRAGELVPRLHLWARWLHFITGARWLNIALLVLGPGWLVWSTLRRRDRSAACDWLLAGFGLAFLGWHWLVAFNTYDRYLHALVPLALLLAARVPVGISRSIPILLARQTHQLTLFAVAILAALLMLPGTLAVLHSAAPLGGDQGQHTGIDVLAHYLKTELVGEIVYDHWLGWELAYYLGPEPALHLRYVSQPEALAEEMLVQPIPCYFAAPTPQFAALWLRVLSRAGIMITPTYHDAAHGFVIYRLTVTP